MVTKVSSALKADPNEDDGPTPSPKKWLFRWRLILFAAAAAATAAVAGLSWTAIGRGTRRRPFSILPVNEDSRREREGSSSWLSLMVKNDNHQNLQGLWVAKAQHFLVRLARRSSTEKA
jgi:hypothetical protein